MSVTVSGAFSNYGANTAISAQDIEDTLASIITNIELLKILDAANNIDSLTISGIGNSASLAQIASIMTDLGNTTLSLGNTAKLTISDSFASISAAVNAPTSNPGLALALATTVTLKGVNTGLTASQANALATQPNFAVTSGASLGVTDSAANILTGGAGVNKATAITVSGQSNTVTVAESLILAAKPSFTVASGATLEVTGSATELLLSANAAGVNKATKVTLTGTTNSLNAANAVLLVSKKAFNIGSAATLVVTDSAINLLASAAAPVLTAANANTAKMSVKLMGANTVTAAQAATFAASNYTLYNGATLVVADTAANILAANANGIENATAFSITGTVTAAQATSLAALTNFNLLSGTTLTIADTAANIVLAGNSTGVAKASMFSVSGTLTAAQAKTLAGLSNYALKPGSTLTISDTAANIALVGNSAGVAKASTFIIDGKALAADATLLAAKANFVLASGSSLIIYDSAANLTSAGNTAGVAKANALQVNGTATAAQATILAAKTNFLGGTTLVVADTAANLLSGSNAAGIAKATTVTATGANTGANFLTAAQLNTLASKPNFTLGSGATLEVKDSAANLVSSNNVAALTKSPAIVTKVSLTGANTVTAAQATILKDMTGFDKTGATSLVVADSSANLLANQSALSNATAVKLNGTTNTVSVADATYLKSCTGFALNSGASLVIADTSANLLGAAALAGTGITFKLTGNANTVTVAEANTLKSLTGGFALSAGATLVVSDTATNLLDSAAAAKMSFATTVLVKGTTNEVTAANAAKLAALPNFNRASGATLVVTDNSTNLLSTANASGVSKASTVKVSGTTNTVSAAQATFLKALPNFSLAIPGTTKLTVSDTAANLLNPNNSDGVGIATTVTATGTSNTVTVAQATTLAGKPNFTVDPSAKLIVTGTKTELFAGANAAGLAKATSVQLTGTSNSATITEANTLAGLASNKFSLAVGAKLVVTGNADDLLAGANAAGVGLATTITLSGANEVSAAEATTLANRPNFGLLNGATTLEIADTAANIFASANAKGVAKGTKFTLTGVNLLNAANATLLAAKTGFNIDSDATLFIADTAANLKNLSNPLLTDSQSKIQLLGTSNTLTAAEAQTIATSSGFELAPGATLTIQDTAANIMATANSDGVQIGTTVKVTGVSAAISAADAAALAELPNFALVNNATLPVTDTSTNLLASSNAAGVALATTVKLSGTANTVTAEQATTLAAKPGFAFATPGTTQLTIEDTATNLLTSGNAAGIALATAVTLIGSSNTVTAAQATTFAGLANNHFSVDLAGNATLEIADTAANLLDANYANGLNNATTVTLTGTGNERTASESTTLAGLPNFNLASGATLVLGGSSSNILDTANAAGRAIATTVKLTGTANTVNAADAAILAALPNFFLNSGATLTIADTSANILGLSSSELGIGTTITVTGTSNVVTAADALLLAAMPNFSVDTGNGATLEFKDTSDNILDQNNATALANATKVTLTGTTNTVTASQGVTLIGKPGFNLDAGAELDFVDTSANILAGGSAALLALATTVKLTGTSNNVSAAQATTLAGEPNFAKDGSATLKITDTATNLLSASNNAGVAIADTVELSGANATNAADALRLKALAGFTRVSGATLVVTDTAANLLTANPSGLSNATTVKVSGTSNAVNATEAATLAALPNFARATGATLEVKDDAATLLDSANANGVAKATTVILSGTNNTVTAAQATSLVLKPLFALETSGVTKLVVEDTASNILGAGPGVSKATSFTVTGTPTVALATSLTTLDNWNKTTGSTITIADTGANLVAGLSSTGMGEADTFVITGEATEADATVLTASGTKWDSSTDLVVTDTAVNLLAHDGYDGLVNATAVNLTGSNTGILAAEALTIASNTAFAVKPGASFVIEDTAANLVTALGDAGMTAATSFKVTGVATAAEATTLKGETKLDATILLVTDTAANLLDSLNSLGVNAGTTVKVSGSGNIVTAAEATILAALHNFALDTGADLIVADTATNIQLSGNSSGMANASAYQVTGDTTVAKADTLTASGTKWDTTQADLVVADTATNLIYGHGNDGLTNAGTVKLIGTSNIVLAADADQMAGENGFVLGAGAELVVADTAANILVANLDLTYVTSFDVGADGTITAENAKDLEALGNFTLKAGTAMVVTDDAANILTGDNAPGIAKATAFDVSGDTAITAENAKDLAALSNFTLKSGTTMVIVDTATNILISANAAGVAKATAFDVSSAPMTASEARRLEALNNFALANTTTMEVNDTAANLLMSTNADGLAAATLVKLTGTSNTVTAAQATSLAAKNGFVLDTGASLLIADTATNILAGANSAGIAVGTKFQVKGAATVAQADLLEALTNLGTATGDFTLAANTPFVVSGTATEILAGGDGVALATAFQVTGTTTAENAKDLAALPNFATASGSTLVITDTVANILDAGNSSGVAKADAFSVSGSATAAEATTLSALMNFAVASGGALVVIDSADNLLDGSYSAGVGLATTVKVTGTNNIVNTVADATTLVTMPNFALDTNATLVVVDNAVNLLGASPAVKSAATTIKLSGANTGVTAANATALAGLNQFDLDTNATLVVEDTAANLLSNSNSAGMLKATTVKLNGGASTVNAAEATLLAGKPNFSKTGGATLVVRDSAANLLSGGNSAGLTVASSVSLSGQANSVSAAQAATLGATQFTRHTGATLEIKDTATNLLGTSVNYVWGLNKATSLLLTGTSNTMTAAQATNFANRLSLDTGATLVVADSAANLLASPNSTGMDEATTITLTGTSNIVTAAQATLLAGKPGFGPGGGATLVVADTALQILSQTNSTGVAVATTVKVTGSNTLDVQKAASLALKTGITIDTNNGATLIIADTATNLLGASAGTMANATIVKLTGTANAVNATEAATLAALTQFTVDAGATLVLTDTTTNLLGLSTSALNKATTVKVSGTSNTVNAAQATLLAGKPGFGLVNGASMVISDSATNLLSNSYTAGLAAATKFQVTGSVSASEATTLKANAKLDTTTGLTIADSAANLLLTANANGVKGAAAVKVTGSNTGLTAAQATALKKLATLFLVDTPNNATLVVCDSATNLLLATTVDGVNAATTVKMTGTTNVVTAAQAGTLNGKNNFTVDTANGSTMVVADTAANLLNASAPAMAKATSVTLTGAVNTVSAGQALTLSAMTNFALGSAATLIVADSKTNLLASANAAGVAKATTVKLTGTTNVATAEEALTLVKKPNFTLDTNATLVVADSSANLLNTANKNGVDKATTVKVTGTSNVVTAAQAVALANRLNFSVDTANNATLVVADTATNILLANNATGIAKATSVKLTGTTNILTAAIATTLAGKASGAVTLDTNATLVVADTAANLLNAANTAGLAKATTVQLTGTSNTVSAAQALTLYAQTGFTRSSGSTLIVADNATNLLAAGKANGVNLATTVQLTGANTGLSVTQAVALGAKVNFMLGSAAILTINDTLVNIKGKLTELEAMAKNGKISSVTVTDSTLTLTEAEYFASASIRSKITSQYSLSLTMDATSTTLNNATDLLLTKVASISASAATAAVSIDVSKQTEAAGFTLTGGSGADTIKGSSGTDTIKGGAGADNLTGGGGADTFDYTTFTNSLISGFDTINDFTQGDKIKVSTARSGSVSAVAKTATGNLTYDISSALTASNFVANGAALVTLSGPAGGTYLVINDGTAAFSSTSDAVVKMVGPGATASNITFIT